ncbi:MAG: hypothetical protein JSV65_08245 [Armatimonadota bacterium]|nr:MAG: hypothetical protein JSV65_08245 [Armatimonadota bacterium]
MSLPAILSRNTFAREPLKSRRRCPAAGRRSHAAPAAFLILALTVIASSSSAYAKTSPNCRFYIATQHDYEQKLGFYLNLKGASLGALTLTLAVADGAAWRYAQRAPGFAAGREYEIRAVLAPNRAQLFLDGNLVAESAGTWRRAGSRLDVNYRPGFTPEGEWLALVRTMSVVVTRGDAEIARHGFDFSDTFDRPLPLQLFEPGDRRIAAVETGPEDTITIDAAVRFAGATLEGAAPFVDPYGQCRYANWPDKVRSDEDLRADIAREDAELAKMPPSPDYDEYGGYNKAGWSDRATGFFHVVRRDGYWWLISPKGNPCFYLGVSAIPAATSDATPITGRDFVYEWLPPQEGPLSQAGSGQSVRFHTANLIRKYGEDWADQAAARAIRRIRAWGFSGGGKWGAPSSLVSVPVLGRGATPSIVRHPDIFDPEVREVFGKELERQIAPRRDDPRILGWSLGNEWGEVIAANEITSILAKPAEVPAKCALADYAVDELYGGSVPKLAAAWQVGAADRTALYACQPTPPAEDVEQLRRFYADRYYDFIYRTVKLVDPNHLYFGFWVMSQWSEWWPSEDEWRLIAPYCDVIGYDRYAREYDDPRWRRMEEEAGKPTLCGEFSFAPWHDGRRGFGRYEVWARDEADAGEMYHRWVQAAARDPYSVGLIHFLYHDQPITGRGPGQGAGLVFGENFAFGLVTETDRPKWELVRRYREANLQAAQWRLEAMNQ